MGWQQDEHRDLCRCSCIHSNINHTCEGCQSKLMLLCTQSSSLSSCQRLNPHHLDLVRGVCRLVWLISCFFGSCCVLLSFPCQSHLLSLDKHPQLSSVRSVILSVILVVVTSSLLFIHVKSSCHETWPPTHLRSFSTAPRPLLELNPLTPKLYSSSFYILSTTTTFTNVYTITVIPAASEAEKWSHMLICSTLS